MQQSCAESERTLRGCADVSGQCNRQCARCAPFLCWLLCVVALQQGHSVQVKKMCAGAFFAAEAVVSHSRGARMAALAACSKACTNAGCWDECAAARRAHPWPVGPRRAAVPLCYALFCLRAGLRRRGCSAVSNKPPRQRRVGAFLSYECASALVLAPARCGSGVV